MNCYKRIVLREGAEASAQLKRVSGHLEQGREFRKFGMYPEAIEQFKNAGVAAEYLDARKAASIYLCVAKMHAKAGEEGMAGINFEKTASIKEFIMNADGRKSPERKAEISDLYADATQYFLLTMLKQPSLSQYGMYTLPERAENAWLKSMEHTQDRKKSGERLKAMMDSISKINVEDPLSIHDVYNAFLALKAEVALV